MLRRLSYLKCTTSNLRAIHVYVSLLIGYVIRCEIVHDLHFGEKIQNTGIHNALIKLQSLNNTELE